MQTSPSWNTADLTLPGEMGLSLPVACGFLLLLALSMATILFLRQRSLARMAAADGNFVGTLHGTPHVLSIFQNEEQFGGSARWPVYAAGCRELAFYLIGSDQVDKNFATRLRAAGRIHASQMDAVRRAMKLAARQIKLDLLKMLPGPLTRGRILPWLGLLGAAAVLVEAAFNPEARNASLPQLIFPALVPLMFSILLSLVIIPAAAAQSRKIGETMEQLDLFAMDLSLSMERSFVDHRQERDELPSLAGLGVPEAPSFSLPPSDAISPLAAP